MSKGNRHRVQSSSSSSDSDVEVNVIVNEKRRRHHRKSSSSSDSECSERKSSKKGSKKCSKKGSKKGSKKCSKKGSKRHHSEKHSKRHHSRKHSKRCSSSSSSSDCKEKVCFDDIYKYYKYRLLTDNELMAGGSSSYINTSTNTGAILAINNSAKLEQINLINGIDYPYFGSPYYIREDGIYILFFVVTSDQAIQFTLFVNGQSQDLTRYGNNSGGGQLVLRAMLSLNKDDAVVVRNNESAATLVTTNINVGGLQVGNDMTFLIIRIAPKTTPECLEWKDDCISHKKLYLFKKIMDKMLCDKELMLQGFNVHGTFSTQVTQVVATEANVLFTQQDNVNGLTWSSSTPDEVTISEDGIYKVFFLATTAVSAQFTFYVNGAAIDYSTMGSNKGASQITIRSLLQLNKNDKITVKNHTSPNGGIVITERAGGGAYSNSAILNIFKIAPFPTSLPVVCNLNKYHMKCYLQFKQYLLHKDCLQIAGSPAYFAVVNDTRQIWNSSNPTIYWMLNVLMKNVSHTQGTKQFVIQEDGIYDMFADIATNEPSQFTLYINGSPDLATVAGKDSGAGRTLMRHNVKLFKNDVITVNNYDSHAVAVTSIVNAGGALIGQNAVFMAFKLSPLVVCPSVPCPPVPCPPAPCADKKPKSSKRN